MRLISCIIIVFFFSCSNPKEEYINRVCCKLSELNTPIMGVYSYVIIIPGSGCSGCITDAENFYIRNKDSKKIFFIFTDVLSVKSIKLKVGKNVMEKTNVYFDMNDDFLSNDYKENVYPLIFNIKDEGSVNYHFLNPDEKLDL